MKLTNLFSAIPKQARTKKLVMITARVSPEFRAKLKSVAAANGHDVQDVVMTYLQAYVAASTGGKK